MRTAVLFKVSYLGFHVSLGECRIWGLWTLSPKPMTLNPKPFGASSSELLEAQGLKPLS